MQASTCRCCSVETKTLCLDGRSNNFGPLRVMNDDLVQPSRGFGAHPHRDAEIVTYIVQGQLTHKDSMGTRETLGRGSVQFMTAGSGVTHSEHNLDAKHPLRFIQMWFTPRRYRPPPQPTAQSLSA
jgi:redox-sensitive bicupin YhaK (pirin superfamily)